MNLVFPSQEPRGHMRLRLASGKKYEKPALIWETVVISSRPDAPNRPDKFGGWLESAHALTHDWFFKMIDGELLRRFSGE